LLARRFFCSIHSGPMETKKSKFSVLGTRMKEYEAVTSIKIDPLVPYVIRLDGHKFSSFTAPFNKPGDIRIHSAMVNTMCDLVEQFRASTGFTCSDEITLVFPIYKTETGEMKTVYEFAGKVQKLTTLTAGYASMCFYKYITREKYDHNEQHLLEHIEKHGPHFDARIFNVPTNSEIVNNIMWRSLQDYQRNSISSLAQCHYNQKILNGKSTKEQLAMLLEKGIDWHTQPMWYKFGTFAKKERFEKEVELPNGTTVKAIRSRMVTKDIEMSNTYTQEQEDWIMGKYWPDTIPTPLYTNPDNK